MKKTMLALLLAFALILSSVSGFAETLAGDALPTVGETINGFTVTQTYMLNELDATCILMEHDKTGALLTYVANEDTDRVFDITFRTPAVDDKGIPHVFEHATLCGSEKYPDPSLFFNMMYQTYNTFLNAMTMTTCTSYPASSLSEEQLYVYADYFLSGVFHPLIVTDERAMMREAYRYELTDADADITLAGTVYSEMQGAITPLSRAGINLRKLLYPGSITTNIAGGEPTMIPEMTHQELKDFHDTYYHPSNSMIVLYGKLDYRKFLKLIDEEYLSKYERREITLPDDAYAPFEGYREQVFTVPMPQDSAAQPTTIYGISLQNATAQDRVLMSVVASALSMESSPFQKRYREKLPNAIVSVGFDEQTKDLTLMFMGMNIGEADKDAFKTLTDEAIAEVLADGLDMGAVESQCLRQHYADIIARGQSGTGSSAAINIASSWGITQDPLAYKTAADVKASLMDKIETDAFNETFKRLLTNPVRSAMAVTIPEEGGAEQLSAELKQALADKKDAMTDAEIDALVKRTADFSQWTQSNTENSMIGEMKAVSVQTLPEEIVRYEAEDRMVNGMRVITSAVPLDDVIQIDIGFDASALTLDQLRDYSVMVSLLTNMPTETYDRAQLTDALSDNSYTFSFVSGTIGYKDGGYRPTFTASFITMRDKLENAFALLEEILYKSDFSDVDLLRRTLNENVTGSKMLAGMMPDYLILGYGMPLISEQSRYSDYLTGDGALLYQQEIAEMSDEEIEALIERISVVRDTLLNQNGFYIGCAGEQESIDKAVACAGELYAKLDGEKREPTDYAELLPRMETPLASVIDGTIQYNMLIASMEDSGFEESGKMLVMNRLMQDKILMQVLRFQNSAYGVRGALDGDMVYVYSYRDPNLAETYEVYETLGDRIRAVELTQDDLDGYISSVYSALASPFSALAGGTRAVDDALTGETTFDDYLRYMREVKAFSLEDVNAYAAIYDMLAEKGEKVTVGGAEAIEKNRDMFKTVVTIYIE